jgi:hypothetical protein
LASERKLAVVAIDEHSAVRGVMFRTSRLRNALHNELADLGVETLNLTLAVRGVSCGQHRAGCGAGVLLAFPGVLQT